MPTHPSPRVREPGPPAARPSAKAAAIADAATVLFLEKGYLSTTMDEIAAAAGVAKQTVYAHFDDKRTLFTQIVLGAAARARPFITESIEPLERSEDIAADLKAMARRYLALVTSVNVVRLRRLIVGEAARFPELAREYYAVAPEQTIAALARVIEAHAARGTFAITDSATAARHLAFLILGETLDRALFMTEPVAPGERGLNAIADSGIDAFLAAYATSSKAG